MLTNAGPFPHLYRSGWGLASLVAIGFFCTHSSVLAKPVDFNRDIRPILSENCYKCHGPDPGARKAKLRLDLRTEALQPLKSGHTPIVPGAPEKSELINRITAADPDDRMPPSASGKVLNKTQIDALRQWIRDGAPYAVHWAYSKPVHSALPSVSQQRWIRNDVDRFILARLDREHLKPSAEADRYTLIRRLSLGLTGIPPTPEEVDAFVTDKSPAAYEKLVDRLLSKPTFGEHWARMWLDLARYADSAGYADDPPRTIWAYRDYVIRSFNDNKPFDRFTLEQIAGDLLSNPSDDDLIATAFHRNTMTNNEGGTNDEEFRNAAVVDRVNTTMAVWMATSMACAQCHTHKYDPITQHEYFSFLAFFNNTQDADLKDESPLLELFTDEQKRSRTQWQSEIDRIQSTFQTPTDEGIAKQLVWEQTLPRNQQWQTLVPSSASAKAGGSSEITSGNTLKIAPQQKADTFTTEFQLPSSRLTGIRIDHVPQPATASQSGDSFFITRVQGTLLSSSNSPITGRYVRIELPGKEKILSLAEVQVFHAKENLSRHGEASQSSTAFDGPAALAIDGNTNGHYEQAKSTTHTDSSENPWWELDLKQTHSIDRIVVWNRTDNELQKRLSDFRLIVLDEKRQSLWERTINQPPNPSSSFDVNNSVDLEFAAALTDDPQTAADAKTVITGQGTRQGWKVDLDSPRSQHLTLVTARPVSVKPGSVLQLVVQEKAPRDRPPPALLRFSSSADENLPAYAQIPDPLLQILSLPPSERTAQQRKDLWQFYASTLAPELKTERDRLQHLKKKLADLKPDIVPIMRELPPDKRRKTYLQYRGNYLSVGDEVNEAIPVAFHPLKDPARPDRLALARWLVDDNNPLTARVMANRFWEQLFGLGLVRTSEDFGSQGELPTHPELLDFLALEFQQGGWNIKAFLKMLVTSATYRQSSRVTPSLAERDPENLLLARGPRFRLSAELVRDQALAASGLLSPKMYGPSVRPVQPALGLSAAFGGSLDWKASEGEDRYRRALYTEWRRTSPYPSMATFDAPTREVCTVRRPRSNTPLQALVTLNDPVYVEAAQALAERIALTPGSPSEKLSYGFRLCLARAPHPNELQKLLAFYQEANAMYATSAEKAEQMVRKQPGKNLPPRYPVSELAAWTALSNVLLNLDEMLMPP
jgi:hypothetical protein